MRWEFVDLPFLPLRTGYCWRLHDKNDEVCGWIRPRWGAFAAFSARNAERPIYEGLFEQAVFLLEDMLD